MPRIFDLVFVAVLIPIIVPLLALVSVIVWLDVGSPIFFRQNRGGYRGEKFSLWKFRTMTNERDNDGKLLPDSERLTTTGKTLRALSLDEIPSFINLVKGDIRLVGPRPFIADYLELYSPEQARRHDVVPGITGWAQITGRNTLTWEEKFALDLWYVDNRSGWLDLKILWLTFFKVIRRQNVNAAEHATMPRFTGSRTKSQ